ncbi:MAG: hypothetical protein KTR26_17505 [Flammeovirgaceae bacterium]|nr:hypothetical protein [Flammeovirgaceae bacterium]
MIQGLITAALISLLFYLMSKKSQRELVPNQEGDLEFKAGKMILVLGLIPTLIGFCSLIFSFYLFFQNREGTAEWVLLFIFLLFFGLGIPNVLSGLFYKIVITRDSIKQRTIFNKWKHLDWDEINSINYFALNRDLVLKGNGLKIRCNEFLIGFPQLAHEIADRTGRSIEQLGLPEVWLQQNTVSKNYEHRNKTSEKNTGINT